jgi:Lhr-like helicase
MGNRSKKGDFKPGNNFGKGRPKLPEHLKEIKNLDKDIYKKTISKYISMDIEDLETFLRSVKEKKVKVFDAYIASMIAKGMQTQDISIMEWLATRSVGKVKDEVDHNITNNVHADILNYIKTQQAKLKEP